MSPAVSALWITPVRTFRLEPVDEVWLGPRGVVENRRFMLTRPDGERLRSSHTFWSRVLRARYCPEDEELTVVAPDGSKLTGSARGGPERVVSDLGGGVMVEASLLRGPWDALMSGLAAHPVRIARPDHPGSCFSRLVSLMSDSSVDRLGEEVGAAVDPRRFKMLLSVAGCREPHEEDSWAGRLVRVGGAVVRAGGPIPRCAMTTTDPDSGEKDLDTLRHIAAYRGSRNGSVNFGIYGDVESPGWVRRGDPIELL